MAKTSVIVRNRNRQKLVNKHYSKRKALKLIIKDMSQSYEVRADAQKKLALLPANSNPIKVRNRCAETGRPRGVFRTFGLCRHMIRLYASKGQIPGFKKASW